MRRIAYWLCLALAAAIPSADLPVPGPWGSINRVIGLALVSAWVVSVVMTGRVRKLHPLHLAGALFLSWCAATLAWTADRDLTLAKRLANMQGLAMAFVVYDLHTTGAALRVTLQGYVVGALVSALSVLYNYAAGAAQPGAARYSATGWNPNDVAKALALAVPMAWYLGSIGHGRLRIWRALNLAFPLLAAVAIVLTGSRGGALASVPAFLFVAWSLRKLPASRLVLFAVILAVGIAVVARFDLTPSLTRIQSATTSAQEDRFGERLLIWRRGIELFHDNPWTGVGAGAFRTASGGVISGDGQRVLNVVMHNTYLAVLVEMGLIGAFLFGLMILSVLPGSLRGRGAERGLWAVLFLVWAISAVASTWDSRPQTWFILALLAVRSRLPDEVPEAQQAEPSPEAASPDAAGTYVGALSPSAGVRAMDRGCA